MATERAMFAAGCFWGAEAAFRQASTFWPAEDYHQRYFERHGMVGCAIPPEGSVDLGSEAEQPVSPPISG